MGAVVLRIGLAAVLLFAAQVPLAHADVYTWVDSAGRTNVSNLAPPKDVRIRSVVREKPASAADIAVREARQRAELAALQEQVRSLQTEVEATRPLPIGTPAAPVVYNIISVSPPPPVVSDLATAPVPYADATPAPTYGCVPSWAGCTTWWPGFATSTVVVHSPRARHFDRFGHAHPFGSPPPHARGPFDFPSSLPATTGVPMRR
ncbi:MAG TPA: DUF4124 domain-containing protein [Acidimicrobiia bacterium]|jgi:hypothetical protein|nr:DUF4124 domain-containing protein [Acidimicrobiia bacterium]